MDLTNKFSQHNERLMLKHGGNLEQEAKRLGVHINSLIDASASLVPFALPTPLQNCLTQQINGTALKIYPDRSYLTLREAISKFHKIHSSMVLPGNGASEIITWAARDAANHGMSFLPSPGFFDYKRALRCWNGKFITCPLPLKWNSTFPQVFPLEPHGQVAWITNPHNPTGQCWDRDSLEALLNSQNLVICDEAFLPLVPGGEKESLIPLVANHPNLIVIRSLTKLFSIAGLRLGYAISSPMRLQQWQEWRDPWPVNGLAVMLGIRLMSEEHLLEKQIEKVQNWVKEEGRWLQTNLQKLPSITAHPSAANFQLIESNVSLKSFREALAHKKILLRDCSSFEELGENWLRVSLQGRSNNRRIIKAMQQVLRYTSG